MHNTGKRIHPFPINQDVHSHQTSFFIARRFVIHGGIAPADTFQLVVEIDQNFIQRKPPRQHQAPTIQGLRFFQFAPFVTNQRHDVTQVLVLANNVESDDGFLNVINTRRVRQEHRVIDFGDFSGGRHDLINHPGIGCDDIHVVLTTKPLGDNLHMQKSEKPTAESKPQRH